MSSDNSAHAHVEVNAPVSADAGIAASASTAASLEANAPHHAGQFSTSAGGDGSTAAKNCLPNCTIDNVSAAEPSGFWSRLAGGATSALHTAEAGVENLGTNIRQSARDLGDTIEDKASLAADYTREHPLDVLGYTAGAIVGGTVAVVCSPVELTVGAAIGVGMAGAAAIDGAVYLVKKELQ